MCCIKETHFTYKYTHTVMGLKKLFHANKNQKKIAVSHIYKCKMEFKTKTVIRDIEVHNN